MTRIWCALVAHSAEIGKRRQAPKGNIRRDTCTETSAFDEAQYAGSVGDSV
jgi:hypothetical protein